MKAKDIETLRNIAEFEDATNQERDWPHGWCWRQVRVWAATLNRLCLEGHLETLFRSNRYTGYKLTEMGRAAIASARDRDAPQKPEANLRTLPADIFQDIIGHDDIKELLVAALSCEKPVHVLLAGPPALAKTLFLWDIERAGGENALWLVGSATSKAGLWDLIAQRQPRWLLVDELEKMSAADTAGLLSMMEGGRLVRAKVGRELSQTLPIWVVAATNHPDRLSPELRSRFAIRHLNPYSRDEYLTVVKGVLARREETAPELAEEVAQRLDGRTQDVRDAIRVARLAPQVGVEKAVQLLLGDLRPQVDRGQS